MADELAMSDGKTQRLLLEMEFEVDSERLSQTQMYFLIMDALPIELPDAQGEMAAELQEARFLDYSGAVLRPREPDEDTKENDERRVK